MIYVLNCRFPLIKSFLWLWYHAMVGLLSTSMCFWSDSVFFLDVSGAASLLSCLFSYRSQSDESLYDSDMEQMRAEELHRPGQGSGGWEASRYQLSNVFTLNSSNRCTERLLADNSHFCIREVTVWVVSFPSVNVCPIYFSVSSYRGVDTIPSTLVKYNTMYLCKA